MNTCSPQGWKDQVAELIREGDRDKFFTYFEGGKDTEGVFVEAERIFSTMFLNVVKDDLTEQRRCLDIGYGSGAMMFAAAKHFEESYGVDVHEGHNFVRPEWTHRDPSRAMRCFTQTVSGEGELPYPDNYFNFIYSWVTISCFQNLGVLEAYLKEIYRVLDYSGISLLYFPRLVKSKSRQTTEEYSKDVTKENSLEQQYREGGEFTPIRGIRLVVGLSQMIRSAASAGFEESTYYLGSSYSHSPEGKLLIGGQHAIGLRKGSKKPTAMTTDPEKNTMTTPIPPVVEISKPKKKRSIFKPTIRRRTKQ